MKDKTANVVIGAGYGDEGKGLTTDWLCARTSKPALGVRFSAGAQAGHTVQTSNGTRHVFAHFTSATLSGVPTYLSRFFVCHPIAFHNEYNALKRLGVTPKVNIDPRAMVTTPYDIMVNQALESARAGARHGSCGMGFGETIEREEQGMRLRACDLWRPNAMRTQLRTIRDSYLPKRLAALGLAPVGVELLDDSLMERYIEDTTEMAARSVRCELEPLARTHYLVFEGAQGLMLDMEYGAFPHVTRAHTGLRNAATLALETGHQTLEVTYVTRAYVTRHGAGPLANETQGPPASGIVDPTNVPNLWQHTLRFAHLDIDVLSKAIITDLAEHRAQVTKSQIMVTCIDQMDEQVECVQARTRREVPKDDLARTVARATRLDCARSEGPTRDTVTSEWRP